MKQKMNEYKTYEQRKKQTVGNLLFSYGVEEDIESSKLGYKFLGMGFDNTGIEVHIWEIKPIEALLATPKWT